MISWSSLLTGELQLRDSLRYSASPTFIPKIVVWNTTSRCNLSCRHCYFEATSTEDPHELTKLEAQDFIEDLAGSKVPVLLFSGGEPLLRKDIFELGRFANDKGIRSVLSTNGTLITEAIAERIKDAGFSYIGISLDGMQEVNDWFRQKKGAFSKALRGIRNCKNVGLKVGLRFTITRDNFKELEYIFKIVETESIPRLCLYHLVYTGRGRNLKERDINHQEKRKILDLIWQRTLDFHQEGLETEILTVDNHADAVWIYLRLKKMDPGRAEKALRLLKIQGGNSSGLRIGAVDNHGEIYADQFWRSHSLGNIRRVKFSEVWKDGKNGFLNDLRNRKDLLKGRCKKCKYLAICNGNFRARAEAVFGDSWSEDPACYLNDEEIAGGEFSTSLEQYHG